MTHWERLRWRTLRFSLGLIGCQYLFDEAKVQCSIRKEQTLRLNYS